MLFEWPRPTFTTMKVKLLPSSDHHSRSCSVKGNPHQDLLWDEKLGIIERVPYGEPVEWRHRMMITRKHDGTPRHTVDISRLNKQCKREAHTSESPFHVARRIPANTHKTVTDVWNGYHLVELQESDRHLTTFATPNRLWRYKPTNAMWRKLGRGFSSKI